MSLRQELYTALEFVDRELPMIESPVTSLTEVEQDKIWRDVCRVLAILDDPIINIANSWNEKLFLHSIHYCKIFGHEVWNDYERGKNSRRKQLSYFEWAVPNN